MTCKKTKKQTPQQEAEHLEGRRANLRHMYERVLALHGSERAGRSLLRHRLSLCARASDCGRLCPHLMKGIGVALVHCAEAGTDKPLYGRLADVDFACPKGLF